MTKTSKAKLNELTERYGENKKKYDLLKKIVDSDNAAIKAVMAKEDISEYEHAGWILKYTIQHRESLNTEALLEYLLKHAPAVCEQYEIVKTKQYLDMDALEAALYHDGFDKKVVAKMDTFKEVKEVPTLKISKAKE